MLSQPSGDGSSQFTEFQVMLDQNQPWELDGERWR